ncbi:hypothetical protein GBAR_LOCUS7659 [Geodia barretti]|uniref:Uncharacterized protein n=1 Tax=Geodia barretti TaxID=519541 RepID=A0AA35RI77_GEOBA|nr:hypothetical protein GBAR_LOCUS7659 [Geodia barretti]
MVEVQLSLSDAFSLCSTHASNVGFLTSCFRGPLPLVPIAILPLVSLPFFWCVYTSRHFATYNPDYSVPVCTTLSLCPSLSSSFIRSLQTHFVLATKPAPSRRSRTKTSAWHSKPSPWTLFSGHLFQSTFRPSPRTANCLWRCLIS